MVFPQEMFDKQTPTQTSCKKEKRSVRFCDFATVSYVRPCSTMNGSEKKDVWYDCDELDSFRKNARVDAKVALSSGMSPTSENCQKFGSDLFLRSLSNPNLDFSELHINSIKTCSQEVIDYREQIRGLEHRLNNERQRNRHITRLATLEAQRRLRKKAARQNKSCPDDPDAFAASLAKVSCKFSKWAREIAHQTGVEDAYAVTQLSCTAPCIENFIEIVAE